MRALLLSFTLLLSALAFPAHAQKQLPGLTEGTETLACFAAMCLWPSAFAVLAWGFAGLCLITIVTRLAAGWALPSSGAP